MGPPEMTWVMIAFVAIMIGVVGLFTWLFSNPGGGRLCDQAVASLQHSQDLVEVQRAGILIHELDCSISRRWKFE